MSPAAYVVWPVPPLVSPNVPASVIAPVVDDEGVKPLNDVWKDVTPPVEACHDAVVPFDVRTYPLVPIGSRVALFVPLPRIKSPVDVIGESALNAADADVWPVPPLVIETGVERLNVLPTSVKPVPAE